MNRLQSTKATLLIPVENQVRELDPKLLLACIAARHGFSCVFGSRHEMHSHISSFPPGIYLYESMTASSDLLLRIMRNLGHEIVVWDEEALVHLPPFSLNNETCIHPFARGQDNAELREQYPELALQPPIHLLSRTAV